MSLPPIQKNVQMILEHLKERKGWKMREVAEQAFFLSVDERERFYRWMMRAKSGKITERHGSSAIHERTLRWLIHSEKSLFEGVPDLSKFDLIEEVSNPEGKFSNVLFNLLRLKEEKRREVLERTRIHLNELKEAEMLAERKRKEFIDLRDNFIVGYLMFITTDEEKRDAVKKRIEQELMEPEFKRSSTQFKVIAQKMEKEFPEVVRFAPFPDDDVDSEDDFSLLEEQN